jgi:lipopolysaccharide transport system permease protein
MMNLKNKSIKLKIDSSYYSIPEYFLLLYRYFPIVHSLGQQQIKSKYASTLLGLVIMIIKLVLTILIYYFVFGVLIKVDVGDINYILFLITGYFVWSLFISIVGEVSASLLNTKNLYSKIFIPKICIPVSHLYIPVLESFISLVFIIILMFALGIPFQVKFIFVPILLVLNVLIGLSIGLAISIASVKKRDVLHLIPYLIGFGFFLTPVFYSTTIIPDAYSFIIYLNPLAFIIDLYRWIIFDCALPNLKYLYGFIPVILIFVWSFNLYRKNDKKIVDYICKCLF